MNIKNFFKYKPQNKYDFNIQATENATVQDLDSEIIKEKVFYSLQENLEYIKSKYNALINSDIIIREFSLTCKNKQYNAFLIYIDGMTDSVIINDFVLRPLMLKNKSNTYKVIQPKTVTMHTPSSQKNKINELANYIYTNLVPNNNL